MLKYLDGKWLLGKDCVFVLTAPFPVLFAPSLFFRLSFPWIAVDCSWLCPAESHSWAPTNRSVTLRQTAQSDDASAFRCSSENYLIKVKRSFGLLIARRQERMKAPEKGKSCRCWRQRQIAARDSAETVRQSGSRCWLALPPRCH